ncbi:MAG: choice-of-anchor tandem repeat NxxGxxAF-containing protein [Planctomycetota bacterium]
MTGKAWHLPSVLIVAFVPLLHPALGVAQVQITQLALTGDIAPLVGSAGTLEDFGAPVINASGRVAFSSFVQGGSNGGAPSGALFLSGGGLPEVSLRFGDTLPSGDAIRRFNFLNLSDAGDIAFRSPGMVFSREVVFAPAAGPGSPLGVVARENVLAPGVSDGALFADFLSTLPISYPLLNARGQVALTASLRTGAGPPVSASSRLAIFGPTDPSGAIGLVARTGAPAPGVDGGLC